MTVGDVINEYDSLRTNSATSAQKIAWLKQLEKKVTVEVLRHYDGYSDSQTRHEDMWVDQDGILHLPPWMYIDDDMNLVIDEAEDVPMPVTLSNLTAYIYRDENGIIRVGDMPDAEFGVDSLLSIPDPYSEVYLLYIDMKIAFWNNDSRMYNVAAQEFNNAYLAYQQLYNRTHTPDKPRGHLIRHEVL